MLVPSSLFSSICEQYVSYLISHYSANSAVVFDGYEDVNSSKRAEQKRRGTSKTSVDVNFYENMLVTVQWENFLANEKSKTKLIELLVETLTARGIEASTATGDTDGSIVRCGLDQITSHSSVVVIREDVDLLVLLTVVTPPDICRSYPLVDLSCSSTVSQGVTQHVRYSTKNKLSILKCFLKMPNETKAIPDIFYDPTSTPDAITLAGEEMFLTMYQAPPSERYLNNHRHNSA
ncbi:hypothetical protein PR048_007420 [Dryococelus australis]|uniref:Uncharacterized protein n=1 Tax=Dryococelus australis TaxID=614101 RepID=A0ABQ9HUA6_9NEOP|nr:hypothetical protein PR048_007420 [Dryococelus australis]